MDVDARVVTTSPRCGEPVEIEATVYCSGTKAVTVCLELTGNGPCTMNGGEGSRKDCQTRTTECPATFTFTVVFRCPGRSGTVPVPYEITATAGSETAETSGSVFLEC